MKQLYDIVEGILDDEFVDQVSDDVELAALTIDYSSKWYEKNHKQHKRNCDLFGNSLNVGDFVIMIYTGVDPSDTMTYLGRITKLSGNRAKVVRYTKVSGQIYPAYTWYAQYALIKITQNDIKKLL